MQALSFIPVLSPILRVVQLHQNKKALLERCGSHKVLPSGNIKTTDVPQPIQFKELFADRVYYGTGLCISIVITALALTALAYYSSWSLIGLKGIKALQPLAQLSPKVIKIATALYCVLSAYWAAVTYDNIQTNKDAAEKQNIFIFA